MNKKRLGKFIALSSVFVLSTVTGLVISGCNQHTHNLIEVAAVDPTCTTDGRSAYYVCDGCDLIFSDAEGKTEIAVEDTVVEKLGHDLEHHEADPATCTKPGHIEYWECTRGDGLFSDAEGKTPVENVETTKEHTWGTTGHHELVDPTTEAEGVKEYWHCSECNLDYADEFGDRQVTLDELKIEKVSENIDGVLTDNFYPTNNALIIGAADVNEGGKGIIINAVRANDGVYLHIVVNYNVEVTKQPAGKGKIGLYFNVRNSENLNLPGGAGVCLEQAMLMELYLTGKVDYHKPYFLLDFETTENGEDAKTKYTSTWEMFIPHSGFATVNNGAFAEAFETVDGKTALKSGYTYMLTAIGALDPTETFENNGASECALKDGDSWAFWTNNGHGDWGSDQKYYVLGTQGITPDFQRATDVYTVEVNDYTNATVTGLTETVDYDKALQGTITVDEGYCLSGIKVNGQVFTFVKADGANTYDYEIAVADLTGLKWNQTVLTVEIVITKLDYQTVEVTLQGIAGGKTENIAQGTSVTLTNEFGDEYTAEVGADGKVLFENILCQDYSVIVNNYLDGSITVIKGEATAESVLEYHFAHNVGTRPDLVDLTDMNSANASVTLGAQGENGVDQNNISVQLNLSEEMKNAESYVLYTTVTVNGEVKPGEGRWLQRFGIRFAEGDANNTYQNKFVVWWDDLGLNSNPSAIWANNMTTCGGAIDRKATYDWLASSVLDGLQLKVVRNGGYVAISAYSLDDERWYTLLEGTTSANAKNDITFFVSGESFTFSEISFEKLEVINRVLPQGDTAGRLEHLKASNGDIFHMNGTIATDASLVLKTANVNVTVNAFEMDGKTEVTLADGTAIILTGTLETYTYTVGGTFTELLVDEYEVYLYGYGKVSVTVSESGGNVEINLTKVFAYTEVGTHGGNSGVTVDEEKKGITITGNGLVDDNATWAGSAELVISDELKNSKNVVLTFNVKDIYTPQGAWDWAARRFGVTMQGANGGFMCFTPTSEEASLYVMGVNPGAESGKAEFNQLAALIRSEAGINMQVLRLGDRIVVNAEVDGIWLRVGEFACDGEDATKIVLYGEGDTFEFSDISVCNLTFVEAQDATTKVDGNIEYYTDGTNYYLTNGTFTTEETVIIPKIVEKTVEICVEVYDIDGNKLDTGLSDLKISLTGEYDYNKDIYTELEVTDGKLALDNGKIYEGVYTVTAKGYTVDTIVINEDTTTLTLKIYQISSYQIVEIEKTYRPESVNTGFNENGVTVKFIGDKGANYWDAIWTEYNCPVPEATLNLPTEIANSKNISLEFNLKLSNQGFWGSNAFGVSVVKDYGGFILRTLGDDSANTTVCELYAQKLCEDNMKALGDNAWIKNVALSAAGLNMRVLRNGTEIALYAQNTEGEWLKLYQISCSADSETEIKFMSAAADFEVSNIVVCTAPKTIVNPDGSVKVSADIVYHEFVAPTIEKDGCNAYYTVGETLYTESGEKTTLEDLKISQLTLRDVTITVKGHKDGEEILLSGTVTATGDYETSFSGTLENGTATVSVYVVTYTVSVDGYATKEFTVAEGKNEYEIVLEYKYANATYAPEKVNLSNMNEANHEIILNAHNETMWADWACPVPEATLTLSDEIKDSKNVSVEFNLKAYNGGFWASNCFGLQMVNGYNGFMFYFSGFDGNDITIYQLHGQKLREDDDKLGERVGQYGWVEELALGANGVDLRAVRTGTSLTLYAKNAENTWVSLGSVTCDENAETEIKFMAGGADFTVSNITVELDSENLAE